VRDSVGKAGHSTVLEYSTERVDEDGVEVSKTADTRRLIKEGDTGDRLMVATELSNRQICPPRAVRMYGRSASVRASLKLKTRRLVVSGH
jgi:hypothetical protein